MVTLGSGEFGKNIEKYISKANTPYASHIVNQRSIPRHLNLTQTI